MDVRGAGKGPRHPKPGDARRRRRKQDQDGGRWHRGAGGTHHYGCCVRGRRWKGRGVRRAGPLPGCRAPPPVRTRELPEAASAVPERLAALAALAAPAAVECPRAEAQAAPVVVGCPRANPRMAVQEARADSRPQNREQQTNIFDETA